MTTAFAFLTRPVRTKKPRDSGLTVVLDKNLGIRELQDLINTAGEWIDLVKFGWGTTACIDRDLVAEKVNVLRAAKIASCPGGTLFELAFLQGRVSEMLEEAAALGFDCVEVSNGTVPMPQDDKLEAIRTCSAAGFRVLSEVGSKIVEEDHRISIRNRIDNALSELEAGAWKVIMEARESGTLGIFQSDGSIDYALLNKLVAGIDYRTLIFEAPRREQQTALIRQFGSNVNLGNIAPGDIIPLETLRGGFRSDTLRHLHMHLPEITLELGVGGARAASRRGDVIVVIDALRATSTITSALACGVTSVRPVATVNECIGDITAGERGGTKVASCDFDNSPLTFLNGDYRGRELVLTSTNGTECILAAADDGRSTVVAASLLNATAVASAALELARKTKRNVSIVMAGRNNVLAAEDQIVATEVVLAMRGAPVKGEYPMMSSDDFVTDFMKSDSGQNLSRLGRTDDVIFCAQKDKYTVVPMLSGDRFITLSR